MVSVRISLSLFTTFVCVFLTIPICTLKSTFKKPTQPKPGKQLTVNLFFFYFNVKTAYMQVIVEYPKNRKFITVAYCIIVCNMHVIQQLLHSCFKI
jgi:hypothetical protein